MNFKLILVVFFLTVYGFGFGQNIQVGVTGALTFSNLSGTGMSNKAQSGINAGGYVLIPLNKKFSIQPEVLYNYFSVNRANNFTEFYVNNSRADSRVSFNLAYLSIPILINYNISPKFIINAGPQYNILISSNENLMYDVQAIKNNDFGIKAGVQFNPSATFNLFASYYTGLNNVNNIDNRYQWKNRQFQIGANVAIFTKK